MQFCTSYQHFRLRLPPDFRELYRRFGRITGCKSAHSHTQHEVISLLRSAIASRMNIVISGGTGSGKTTLANAVIAEIVATAPEDRMVILEDTAEIQCTAENAVSLHTTDTVDMARLLKSTMRLRPDRIIVGEVRDGAALTLLKAWNTGHPGGVTTIHSNTAMSALRRLEQLTAEASQQPMQEVIGETVDLVVSIERTGKGRRVREVIHVEGFGNARYRTEHYAQLDEDSRFAQDKDHARLLGPRRHLSRPSRTGIGFLGWRRPSMGAAVTADPAVHYRPCRRFHRTGGRCYRRRRADLRRRTQRFRAAACSGRYRVRTC